MLLVGRAGSELQEKCEIGTRRCLPGGHGGFPVFPRSRVSQPRKHWVCHSQGQAEELADQSP